MTQTWPISRIRRNDAGKAAAGQVHTEPAPAATEFSPHELPSYHHVMEFAPLVAIAENPIFRLATFRKRRMPQNQKYISMITLTVLCIGTFMLFFIIKMATPQDKPDLVHFIPAILIFMTFPMHFHLEMDKCQPLKTVRMQLEFYYSCPTPMDFFWANLAWQLIQRREYKAAINIVFFFAGLGLSIGFSPISQRFCILAGFAWMLVFIIIFIYAIDFRIWLESIFPQIRRVECKTIWDDILTDVPNSCLALKFLFFAFGLIIILPVLGLELVMANPLYVGAENYYYVKASEFAMWEAFTPTSFKIDDLYNLGMAWHAMLVAGYFAILGTVFRIRRAKLLDKVEENYRLRRDNVLSLLRQYGYGHFKQADIFELIPFCGKSQSSTFE